MYLVVDDTDNDDDDDDDGKNRLYFSAVNMDLSKHNHLPNESSCLLFQQRDDEWEKDNLLVAAQYYKEAADSVQDDIHLFLDFYASARINQAKCYSDMSMYEESVQAYDQLLTDTAFILTVSGSNNNINNKQEVSQIAELHNYRKKAIYFRQESLLLKALFNAHDALDRDDDDRGILLSKHALDDARDCSGYGKEADLTSACALLYHSQISCHFRNQDYTVCKEECKRFLSEHIVTSSWTEDEIELLQDIRSEVLFFLEKCERLGDYITLGDLEKEQQSSLLPFDEVNGADASILLHFLDDQNNIKPSLSFLETLKQTPDSPKFQPQPNYKKDDEDN